MSDQTPETPVEAVAEVAAKVAKSRTLPKIIVAVCGVLILLLGGLVAFYLIGPTAEHIIALVRAWRGEDSK